MSDESAVDVRVTEAMSQAGQEVFKPVFARISLKLGLSVEW